MKPEIPVCRLYVMVGVPGSGKSTWAKKHLLDPNTTKYISRDEIRFSLLGPEDEYFSKEREVWKVFMDKVQTAINDEGMNVIIDASHINKWSRRKLTNALDDALTRSWEIYYVVMDTSYAECCRRNDNRTGRANVPHDAIKEMDDKMTYPKMSEHPHIKGVWIVRE